MRRVRVRRCVVFGLRRGREMRQRQGQCRRQGCDGEAGVIVGRLKFAPTPQVRELPCVGVGDRRLLQQETVRRVHALRRFMLGLRQLRDMRLRQHQCRRQRRGGDAGVVVGRPKFVPTPQVRELPCVGVDDRRLIKQETIRRIHALRRVVLDLRQGREMRLRQGQGLGHGRRGDADVVGGCLKFASTPPASELPRVGMDDRRLLPQEVDRRARALWRRRGQVRFGQRCS